MLLDYYRWRAILRDGSEVEEVQADGSRLSLFRPALDVRTLTLEPIKGCTLAPMTVHVPDGARIVFFKIQRGMDGFDPNRNYAGLWYIATSNPINKIIAERLRAHPKADASALREEITDGFIGDRIWRQASNGCTVPIEEYLRVMIYCIGFEQDGRKSLTYIAPNGETESTDGSEVHAISETGAIDGPHGGPAIIERAYKQLVGVLREQLTSRLDRAIQELEGFKITLNNL